MRDGARAAGEAPFLDVLQQATAPACDHAQGAPARLSWARLLKRVFDIDIEHCPNRGGSLKIIAAIEDPPVIVKILSHLGLSNRAPAALAGATIRLIPNDLRSLKTGYQR